MTKPRAAKTETTPSPRKRRTPEAAREAILLAADTLFRAHGPKAIGLKQVAAEAGVTHGLVTHYFGTFHNLVRAVWQRRNRLASAEVLEKVVAVRKARVAAGVPDGGAELEATLGDFVFSYLTDPYRAELFVWLRASGDGGAEAEERGFLLGALTDFAERELRTVRTRLGRPVPSRAQVERAILLVLAACLGWSLGHETWLAALSREPGPEADAGFRDAMWRAVRALLDEP